MFSTRDFGLKLFLNDRIIVLTSVGLTNTIGRVVAGFLGNAGRVNSLALHNASLICAGLTCICQAVFGLDYTSMAIFSALFGLCIGW